MMNDSIPHGSNDTWETESSSEQQTSGSSSGYETDSSLDEETQTQHDSFTREKSFGHSFTPSRGIQGSSTMITGNQIPPFELVRRVGYSRDISFAGAFIIFCISFLVFAINKFSSSIGEGRRVYESPRLLLALLIPATVASLLALIHFELLLRHSEDVSRLSLHHWLGSVSLLLMGAWMLWTGILVYVIIAILLIITACVDLVRFHSTNERIQFSSVLIETAEQELCEVPLTCSFGRKAIVVHWIWTILWSTVFYCIVMEDLSPIHFSVQSMYCLFVLYWTSQTLRASVCSVASGVIAAKVALGVGSIAPSPGASVHATTGITHSVPLDQHSFTSSVSLAKAEALSKLHTHLLSRSLSSSLGSICAGGLYAGFADVCILTMRPVQGLQHRILGIGPTAGIAKVLMHVVKKTNTFGWSRIAISGAPFHIGSSDTWKKLQQVHLDDAVFDDVSERLLLSYAFIGSVVVVMISMVIIMFGGVDDIEAHMQLGYRHVAFMVAVLYSGYSAISLSSAMVGAVVKSIYVCFAEKPDSLQLPHPIIAHRLMRLSEVYTFTHQQEGDVV